VRNAQIVRAFVKGETEEIEVANLRQCRELFKQFRIFARNLEHDLSVRGGGSGAAAADSAAGAFLCSRLTFRLSAVLNVARQATY
jgi:hypothetical protein